MNICRLVLVSWSPSSWRSLVNYMFVATDRLVKCTFTFDNEQECRFVFRYCSFVVGLVDKKPTIEFIALTFDFV